MRLSTFAAVTIVVLAGCGREDPAPATAAPAADASADAACTLTMGWDPWEPYHYLDPAGEERGLDVELVRAIAAGAGCAVRFDRDNFANLLRRVAEGDIDLISGATRTPEREAYALFSRPYRQEVFVLFTRTADDARFPGGTLKDKLDAGMRIGVTDAYVYGDAVEALRDEPAYAGRFVSAAIGETNLSRLVNREIDGFIEDRFVAAAMLRRRGLEGDVGGDLVVNSSDVRLMFSRASVGPDRVDRMNESMASLRADGEFDAIQGRYLR